ncbi:hypothetical protein LOB94_03600 [Lactobacillus delbrueckii subsp. bulgaricus]|uniref:hypothetical protein n=1 Tax=Lactobacillus delbrueckii TaxID=1584 RepID=UPI00054D261D|nr:hypothetical protein [Lactobacillus delbrueckii]MCD5464880.1 hypothetical protein [Lactobacillus delbrueckii subsp. bulgaricus]MCD5482383.1 hypothetical protein [Lactobacillus delbrueckii subsp. bulgaricus]MCD5482435.1 hypothetical protein [Lactobacillus delbrueckii subsp. bulgaricus]MCT3468543.1 hypothetical protein [Lactobacillus delbrueckii subsp. bulgaricus]
MAEFDMRNVQGGQTLTDFIKAFNELKYGYHACLNNRGEMTIVSNQDGKLMASLLPRHDLWAIEKSTFSCKELFLMANMSATEVIQ